MTGRTCSQEELPKFSLISLLEILSLMSTVEVMICNDEVHQMRLSLMSTVEVMICC
jgi:hypothetical protein